MSSNFARLPIERCVPGTRVFVTHIPLVSLEEPLEGKGYWGMIAVQMDERYASIPGTGYGEHLLYRSGSVGPEVRVQPDNGLASWVKPDCVWYEPDSWVDMGASPAPSLPALQRGEEAKIPR